MHVGKRQMYTVGKIMKARYGMFLGPYREDKVRVSSTSFSRTIMSALLVMAGMFPSSPWIFKCINWQPIPILQGLLEKDMTKLCPRYAELKKEGSDDLHKSDMRPQNKRLYELLSLYTQKDIKSVCQITSLLDGLSSISHNGMKLPHWARMAQPDYGDRPLYPDILKPFMAEYFKNNMYFKENKDMLNIYLVHVFKAFEATFTKVSRDKNVPERFWYHSTHDNTIYTLLRALGVDSPLSTKPGEGLIFELHKEDDGTVVKIFFLYAEGNVFKELESPLCPSPCNLHAFLHTFKPIDPNELNRVCNK